MSVRGVLFDLDGTLADTATAERGTWPSLAAVIERHVPAVDVNELHDRYRTVFAPHWADFLEGRIDFGEYRRRRLREALEPWCELDEELFDAYRAERHRGVGRLRLFDDALPTVRLLRRSGLRVGLLTNGPSSLQRHKLEVTALEPELDSVAISEEIGAAKPEGEAFARALELLGCPAEETAMVGDSPVYDIEGAVAAGLALAVLVRGGAEFALEEAAEVNGATVVERLSEVPAALAVG